MQESVTCRESSSIRGGFVLKTLPRIVLGVALLVWLSLGIWVINSAPFASGTDESINYVAFAAAKNRWATQEDFHRYGIDGYYYPPLYFLVFAPFWGDEPSFVAQFPRGDSEDPHYKDFSGRRVVSDQFLAGVQPALDRLYRQAKLFSLGLGLSVLLALAATLRMLFPGPLQWWAMVLGVAPVLFLPQFLYYHTLCNNDTLLNALGALAVLSFTAAMLALEKGLETRFFLYSVAVATCIGLAVLTKMSALVLFPLLAGLLAARLYFDRTLPWKRRFGRCTTLLAVLVAAAFISGGWWLAYKAGQGDWNSFNAHRSAHPWAMVSPESRTSTFWWCEMILEIFRSYYALFSGKLYISVSDNAYLAWFILPCFVVYCSFIAAIRKAAGWRRLGSVSVNGLRTLLWATLVFLVLLNLLSVLWHLRYFMSPYGRLLFPTLVASHALAVAFVCSAFKWRQTTFILMVVAVVVHSALLFSWTFHNRMLQAVIQPPEILRMLSSSTINGKCIPVSEWPMDQQLQIPAGEMKALRVFINRPCILPQVGAALDGAIVLWPGTDRALTIPLKHTALGDSDFCMRWVEIELQRKINLADETTAILTLRGSPSKWAPNLVRFNYFCGASGPTARKLGTDTGCSLLVAALYNPGPAKNK